MPRLLQHAQGLRQQRAAGIVEHQGAHALEQLHAQRLLQLLQRGAGGGLRQRTAWAAATVLPDWATAQNISTWRSVRCSMGTLLFA
jgi:hypothetical protein